jgi:CelD/BcsL family acetyltransferase involved in cellulose biosynthesis
MAAGAAAGEVRFTDLVDGDGRVVAIEAELIVAGRASFYQAGRLDDHDLRGSGSALKGAVIGRLIDDGCREFDLLRGDERYKTEWATAERRVMMAEVGIGPRGMAVSAAARLKQRFLVARYVARNRLKAQLASVTKSMSSSTAPTSDGSRSR